MTILNQIQNLPYHKSYYHNIYIYIYIYIYICREREKEKQGKVQVVTHVVYNVKWKNNSFKGRETHNSTTGICNLKHKSK